MRGGGRVRRRLLAPVCRHLVADAPHDAQHENLHGGQPAELGRDETHGQDLDDGEQQCRDPDDREPAAGDGAVAFVAVFDRVDPGDVERFGAAGETGNARRSLFTDMENLLDGAAEVPR